MIEFIPDWVSAMALFTRRVLQRLIFENAAFLTEEQSQRHADAINRGTRTSLSAEWEIATLNALSKRFAVEHESGASARLPDVVAFIRERQVQVFVADITTVTEAGRDEQNPFDEFQSGVVARARRYGLRINSFGFQVEGRREGTVGREVMRLHLPPGRAINSYIREHVEPFLEACAAEPSSPRHVRLQDDGVDCTIKYDPKQPYMSSSGPSYTANYSRTRNPLYNALKAKIAQLGGSGRDGPHGVIVCAGDFDLQEKGHGRFGPESIIREAFRQYTRLSFVLTLWTEDRIGEPCPVRSTLFQNPTATQPLSIEAAQLLHSLSDEFPNAVNSGRNALHELDFPLWKRGRFFLGSLSVSKTEIKISARTLLELLAGRITLDEFLDRHGGNRGWLPVFEQRLRMGQLLVGARIERVEDKDDDWIVFQFGDWDPASGPIRANPPNSNSV